MNVDRVLNLMPPVDDRASVIHEDGSNADIISTLQQNFDRAVAITRKCASQFRGANDIESARNVFAFEKENISYKADGMETQDIRLPNRFLQDGEGDCKSFALFACSVLYNLGLEKCCFRFAGYPGRGSTPTHVYCVCKGRNGKEIIVDPVYDRFNAEKPYAFKFDRCMTIRTLSGFGDIATRDEAVACVRALIDKRNNLSVADLNGRRAIDNAIQQLRANYISGGRGEANKIGSNFSDSVIHTAAEVAAFPSRQAFLGLVALNVFDLAHKIALGFAKEAGVDGYITKSQVIPSSKLAHTWYMLGGNWGDLFDTADKAKAKKAILGIEGIGILPAAVAAPAAAAAPIIAAIGEALHAILGNLGDVLQSEVDKVKNKFNPPPAATDTSKLPPDGASEWYKNPLVIGAGLLGAKLLFF